MSHVRLSSSLWCRNILWDFSFAFCHGSFNKNVPYNLMFLWSPFSLRSSQGKESSQNDGESSLKIFERTRIESHVNFDKDLHRNSISKSDAFPFEDFALLHVNTTKTFTSALSWKAEATTFYNVYEGTNFKKRSAEGFIGWSALMAWSNFP